MEDIIINCIDTRKNAIYSTYNVGEGKMKDKIENYFKKLEEFAKECKDISDFETKFATSSFAKEYTDLFVMLSTDKQAMMKSVGEDVTFAGREIVDGLTHKARMDARQEVNDKVMNIPILGDVIQAKQTLDLFSKFKRKKNKKDEEESK